jgi:hypothetical protein
MSSEESSKSQDMTSEIKEIGSSSSGNEAAEQLNVEQPPVPPFWVRTRHRYREYLAEFMGVFTLLMFGCGVVAQVVLSGGQNGSYGSITVG